MLYRIAADLVVLTHFMFVLFVVFGALLALRWPRVILLHLPAAVWGALIEFQGWICPLTPWENRLRSLGGQAGYDGGFIEHYLLPLLYPAGLTRTVQLTLAAAVVAVNGLLYALVWVKWRRTRSR
ncbi:MAG: DUF2784 domain-containing protein [Gemmatimonadales bacterium]